MRALLLFLMACWHQEPPRPVISNHAPSQRPAKKTKLSEATWWQDVCKDAGQEPICFTYVSLDGNSGHLWCACCDDKTCGEAW